MSQDTYEIDVMALDETCDGLSLLLGSARHNGFRRTDEEIREHVRECRECFGRNGDVLA